MSNQRAIVQMVKDISGQSNVLAIPRIFIRMAGDIKAALFLSQCVYWSDKTKRDDGYFYKTAQEWEEETGLTRHELDGARKRTARFVVTKLIKANGAPTLHYHADIDAITEWIEAFYTEQANPIAENQQIDLPKTVKSDLPKTDKSLTETTQEITPQITNKEVVVEPQRPNIYGIYEQEVGPLTPMLADELDDIEKTFPPGMFVMALREAKRSSTRVSLKYILGIMRRWMAEGITPQAENKAPAPRYTGTIALPGYMEAQ